MIKAVPNLEKKKLTTAIWQFLNLFTLIITPSNRNLHCPSHHMMANAAWNLPFLFTFTLKWILCLRHFWVKCRYAAAINNKNTKYNQQDFNTCKVQLVPRWVKSKRWQIYFSSLRRENRAVQHFWQDLRLIFNLVKSLRMCDACLEITYPRNVWRSRFINQRHSSVPTRLPTINSLMSNPTVAPPGPSSSSHHRILRGNSEEAECWDQQVNSAYSSSVSVGETLLAAVETQRRCLDPTGL